MSRPGEDEELVDYDDTETFAPTTTTADAGKAEGEKKGSYVGIHSTGFR
jgi:ATP-dependent RNA helicase UAP56/SUB2